MRDSWAEHVESWDRQKKEFEEPPRPRRPWGKLLGLAALLSGLSAFVIGQVAPNYETIMMLGPFPSGKVRVVLWSAAVLLAVLSLLVPGLIAAVNASTWWSALFVTLLLLVAMPITGFVMLVSALVYDQQPETHKFTTGGEQYVLTSQVGFLIAADDTYLSLYRKDDFRYRNTGLRLTPADTLAFNRDGFTLEREGDRSWLIYQGAGDATERLRIR